MQLACLSIVFSFSRAALAIAERRVRLVATKNDQYGEIFLKLCEPYEAKTAPASSPTICAESVAWISPSNARTRY